MLAEQELLEDYIDGCLRVRAKVRIALEVTLRQDSLTRLPALALIHAQHGCQFSGAQLAGGSQECIQIHSLALLPKSE